MREEIQKLLTRYGQTAVVRTAEGETKTKAFLQPVTERSEAERGAVTELGWTDLRRWRYLGQTPVEAGDTVIWEDMVFSVRSSRLHCIGQTPLYWWAVLEREREMA